MDPEEIKRRFRARLVGNVIALLMVAPASFVIVEALRGNAAGLGVHSTFLIVAAVVLAVAAATFTVITWRCPACGFGFGFGLKVFPSTCPGCDARLR